VKPDSPHAMEGSCGERDVAACVKHSLSRAAAESMMFDRDHPERRHVAIQRTSWSNSFMPGTGIFCSYAWNSCSNTCGGGGAGVLGRTSTSVLRQSRLHFEPRPRVHLH